jgi:argininosuccinate lyase
MTEAVLLVRLVVAGAEPRPERMRLRAAEGFTAATELANRLVLETGISFRSAHHQVGALVTRAAERGQPLDEAAEAMLRERGLPADPAWLDPAAVAAAAAFGGGPGGESPRRVAAELRGEWSAAARRLRERSRRWEDGSRALAAATAGVQAEEVPAAPAGENAGQP